MPSAKDLGIAAEAHRLGYALGLYSDTDLVEWADQTIAALDGPPPDWLSEVSEYSSAIRRKDWGGLSVPPSPIDVVLERVPGRADLDEVLQPLLASVLDLVRRHQRSDAQVVSGLYTLMHAVDLPSEMRNGIYLLDHRLDLVSDGIMDREELHRLVVEFLEHHASSRT